MTTATDTLVRHEMYVMSNVSGNNNKFWEFKITDDGDFHVRNGRVGGTGQYQKPKSFGSPEAAEAFAEKKIKEKLKKGYVKFKGILDSGVEGAVTESVSAGSNLADVAVREIASSSSSETAKLIKYLSKKNIHNITSATTMTYDTSQGTFKTPLGIVTQEGIDEARVLLDELVPYVEKGKYGDTDFIDKLQQYIQLIPRKVGRKLIPEDVFPGMDTFKEEGQVLDALDASLLSVLSGSDDDKKSAKKETKRTFNVKVDVLKDSKIESHIDRFYNKTRNRMHTSSSLHIEKIYTVEIEHVRNAFEKIGKKVGNVMELWHGSRTANLLSILKGGLIIPKGNEAHVTGAMFSTGLYFSDQSTKSLNYSQGYWGHGGRDNNPFMFLCSVAMGKYYVPSGPSSNLPKAGYDSTYAKARQSGVMNNEMIVYKTNQCNLKYLVEFSD